MTRELRDVTHPIIHLVEECAEVTKAAMKGMSYGFHPTSYRGVMYNNGKDLMAELDDLEYQIKRVREYIAKNPEYLPTYSPAKDLQG